MKRQAKLFLGPLVLLAALLGCGRGDPAIRTVDDARTGRVGVMTGTTGEAIAKARLPKAQIKCFDDIMDAVAALKSGQLEGIVTAYPTALNVTKRNPELRRLDEALSAETSNVAVRKGDAEMLAAINRIIAELKADGTLDGMKQRWFKEDLSPYEELKLTLPTQGKVLRIGVAATREPMNFKDKEGRVTGHDGELARLISVKLQRPIEFSDMKFMALITALQSGKVDLIVTGMTATPERSKQVDFSEPYFMNGQVMMVRKEAAPAVPGARFTSPSELHDKRIGVLLGSAQGVYAHKTFPNATILQYKSAPDVILAVKTGKVDAALYDAAPLKEIFRENPELDKFGESLFNVPVGAGFQKSDAKLREDFNTFLRQIKQNGVYADMVERWVNRGDTRMPDIPNPGTKGEFVVGIVSDEGAPFGFVQDNRVVGLDIELAERFAAFLGRKLRLSNMEFGSLIAALASDKIDMIAASMYITEERKQQIDFGDPYFEEGNHAFALKSRIAASVPAGKAAPERLAFLKGIARSFHSNIILENRYLLILDGLKATAIISVLSTVFGSLLGALVCFMRMSKRRILNVPARAYIGLVRGMPVLVILMLIFYVVFASVDISPVLVAVIAFGMNFAAYVAEIYRSGIESIDRGQTEAGIALGFTRLGTFTHIVLPQTVQRILPVYKGEFISLVKMTSIVGYIAVQDLTKASDIIRSRTFDAFFPLVMVAVLYFIISWLLMQVLGYVERLTDPKLRAVRRRSS